uniref:Uncharacterized protein n=1 Tax=Anguilla anguilla TaxID=7936 RepID=A0A0E9UP19_ANGAN
MNGWGHWGAFSSNLIPKMNIHNSTTVLPILIWSLVRVLLSKPYALY